MIAALVAMAGARLAPAQEYNIIHSWTGNMGNFFGAQGDVLGAVLPVQLNRSGCWIRDSTSGREEFRGNQRVILSREFHRSRLFHLAQQPSGGSP